MEIKIARCEKATPLNIHHGKSNLLLQKTAGANDGAALRYYFIIIISASAENVRAAQPTSRFHIFEIPYRKGSTRYSSLGSLLFTTLINKELSGRTWNEG
jgi:hypothetical protein